MDPEAEEYLDYAGCSPGAISSESSNMDRSCSSTPVGNESTSAGEFPNTHTHTHSSPASDWDSARGCALWVRRSSFSNVEGSEVAGGMRDL